MLGIIAAPALFFFPPEVAYYAWPRFVSLEAREHGNCNREKLSVGVLREIMVP